MTHDAVNPPALGEAKGYANGIVANGRLLFIAGQVGWDQNHHFADGFIAQFDGAWSHYLGLNHQVVAAVREKNAEAAVDLVAGESAYAFAKANVLIERVTLLFSNENEKNISETLANLRAVSDRFANGGGGLMPSACNGLMSVNSSAAMCGSDTTSNVCCVRSSPVAWRMKPK